MLLDSTVSKYMYQEPSTSGLTYLKDSITEVNYFQLLAIKLLSENSLFINILFSP